MGALDPQLQRKPTPDAWDIGGGARQAVTREPAIPYAREAVTLLIPLLAFSLLIIMFWKAADKAADFKDMEILLFGITDFVAGVFGASLGYVIGKRGTF